MTVRESIGGFESTDVGHVYFGENEIKCIEEDLLDKPVESSLVIKRSYGCYAELEV